MDQHHRIVAAVTVGMLYEQAEEEAARLRRQIRRRKASMELRRKMRNAMLAYLSTVVSSSNNA